MWMLIHLLIVIALTLTTTWGGLIWLMGVVLWRMARRGVRMFVLIFVVGTIGLVIILNPQSAKAGSQMIPCASSTETSDT